MTTQVTAIEFTYEQCCFFIGVLIQAIQNLYLREDLSVWEKADTASDLWAWHTVFKDQAHELYPNDDE